jgi:hypothetical protein
LGVAAGEAPDSKIAARSSAVFITLRPV